MILHLLIDIFHLFCYLNFLIHLLLLKMIQFQHILRHLKIFQPLYLLLQILHLQLLLYHLHCNLLFLLKLLFFGLCCIFHLLYFLNLLIVHFTHHLHLLQLHHYIFQLFQNLLYFFQTLHML